MTGVQTCALPISGLVKTIKILDGISDIAVINFDSRDIIRHKLVKYIVNAFDRDAELKEKN